MKRILDIPICNCPICGDILSMQQGDMVRYHLEKFHRMDSDVSKIVEAVLVLREEAKDNPTPRVIHL